MLMAVVVRIFGRVVEKYEDFALPKSHKFILFLRLLPCKLPDVRGCRDAFSRKIQMLRFYNNPK
ncbi:hypothetical protein EBU02_03540 [bacterium]|nr:hypothetical protein [bacterium]NBS51445.1 hypothetical protein [Spartobacteria bacterium]